MNPPSSSAPGAGAEATRQASAAHEALLRTEWQRGRFHRYLVRGLVSAGLLVTLALSLHRAKVSPRQLLEGLPRLADWLTRIWPPDLSELPDFLGALWETLAIAIVGTFGAFLLAFPLAIVVARTITPIPWLGLPLRILLNILRCIDAAIFALFFVAVVGLGPFAGVLGIVLHTGGSMGKLFAEVFETIRPETLQTVEATGAGRVRTFLFAALPEAMPGLAGIALYLWEYNVRSSVILGIVGAGGIGYELMVSLKLLDFPRLATILLLILLMVSLIDSGSAWLRRRLR